MRFPFKRNRHSGPDLQKIIPRVAERRSWDQRLLRTGLRVTLVLLILPWLLIGTMRWVDPFYSAFMFVTRAERTINKVPKRNIRYEWVDYESISPAMRLAVIAAEDQMFAQHRGFDWQAIQKAHVNNSRGKRIKGGSTLSQQVAKNLFLWRERGWIKKGIEAYLTFIIETLWPKQRILEVYLNIVQFSPRHFGVEYAARHFFNTSADRLTARQAALLAAVLPGPTLYDAGNPSRYILSRQQWIQRQMQRLGTDYLKQIEQPATAKSP